MIEIKQLQSIQKEFDGLIPSQIIADRLINEEMSFKEKHIEALAQLDELVNDGILNYLNDNDNNSYFRLNIKHFDINGDMKCDICNAGCIEPV